jgi:hypothetical protein
MTSFVKDLADLRNDFPTHLISRTASFDGPDSWESRPTDAMRATVIRHSPDELREAIKDELAGMSAERIQILTEIGRPSIEYPWDREVGELSDEFPGYAVWAVPRHLGGASFSAHRRNAQSFKTLTGVTGNELRRAILEEIAQRT